MWFFSNVFPSIYIPDKQHVFFNSVCQVCTRYADSVFLFVCLCHVSDCMSSMYQKDSNKLNPERNSVFLQQCVSSLPSNSALAKYKKSIEDNFKAVKQVMSDEDQQDQPLPDQLREWSVLSAVSPLSEWFLSVLV